MAFIISAILGSKCPKIDSPISGKNVSCVVTSKKFTPLGFDSEKNIAVKREPFCLDTQDEPAPSIQYGKEYKQMELKHQQNLIFRDSKDHTDNMSRYAPSLDGGIDAESVGIITKLRQGFVLFILYLCGLQMFFITVFSLTLSLIYRQFVKIMLKVLYGSQVLLMTRPGDAVWGYERDYSSSNIVFVFKCKGVPDLERIIDDFERKVLKFRTLERADRNADGIYNMYVPYEKLQWIVREKFLFYCWERDREFNVRNHFFMEKVLDEGNNVDDRIHALCEAYLEHKLDPMKPQWEFRVVAPIGGEGMTGSTDFGLIFCVHHSYGDGVSWLQMLRCCLADDIVDLPIDPLRTPLREGPKEGNDPSTNSNFPDKTPLRARSPLKRLRVLLSLPHAFGIQVARMMQEKNAFHGPLLKGTKFCQWASKSISLESIKSVRQSDGKPFLFTSVVLSCATKALQRCFLHCNAPVPREILCSVPYVNLPYKTLEPLNNFSMMLAPLPSGVLNDRKRRLRLTEESTRRSSTKEKMIVNGILANIIGRLISPLVKLSSSFAARSTFTVSNLPGPKSPLYLFGGQRVSSVFLYPPTKFRTAVNLGVISYCGEVFISYTVDGTIHQEHPKFPFLLMKSLEQEFADIVEDNQPSEVKSESIIAIDCCDSNNNDIDKI